MRVILIKKIIFNFEKKLTKKRKSEYARLSLKTQIFKMTLQCNESILQ